MTPAERASLAEQLLTNPLFAATFGKLEKDATERMIYAKDDRERQDCAFRVQAIRSFRSDCEAALRSNREPKAAPA
jgi:hypothetical protein